MQKFQIIQTPKGKPQLSLEGALPELEDMKVPVLRRAPALDVKNVTSGLVTKKNVARRRAVGAKLGGKRMGLSQVPRLPPNLDLNGSQIHYGRYRFNAASTVSTLAIYDWSLLGSIGGIGTVINNQVSSIASSVRLRRITCWPAAGGECAIYWFGAPGDLFGQPDVAKDESLPTGITVTAPVSSRPPNGSVASMWHTPTTGSAHQLLELSLTAGSIIDVEVDYTLCNTHNPIDFSVATATVANFYYLYLDGSVSHKLTPLGRVSTF